MRGINYRERTLSYLSWPMERVFFTCRKWSVINNNFNNNHFTFCQNDFKYSPSNSHPSYKPFGLLVFLRITWTRVIIYCPKPNPFLRPPTFCSPLSHPPPPHYTKTKYQQKRQWKQNEEWMLQCRRLSTQESLARCPGRSKATTTQKPQRWSVAHLCITSRRVYFV